MRTTVTLEPDVAARIEQRRRDGERSFKEEINSLLRVGLEHIDEEPAPREPFRTEPMIGRLLIDIDDVEAALDYAEGPWRT
ncbi:MAG: hypothetical protein MSC31_00310 [Solirubrobacteraceae bacterium MAG38_C4-C5]|nr:hypothetical protein [Candidatus Siliceabacter maunaloa]